MEFKYKKRAFVVFALMFILGFTSIISFFYELFIGSHSIDRHIFGSIIIFFTGLTGMGFYFNRLSAVISVNDEGITYRNRGSEVFINWSEVTYVEVDIFSKFIFTLKESFIVKIESADKQLEIGSEIKNVVELISFVKGKLGNKFDTKELPIECKVTQRSW